MEQVMAIFFNKNEVELTPYQAGGIPNKVFHVIDVIRRHSGNRTHSHIGASSGCIECVDLGFDTHHRSARCGCGTGRDGRSEEHTSELQSLMRISYAVFCLKR